MNKELLKELLFKQQWGWDIYMVKTIVATIAVEVSAVAFVILMIHLWN